MNTRLLKINAEIQKAVSEVILYDLNNPKIYGIVSITKVDTTSDLSHCKIYVSIAEKEKQQDIFNEIKKASSFIRKNLSKKVILRKTPLLDFYLDNTVENAQLIDEMIEKIAQLRGNENND